MWSCLMSSTQSTLERFFLQNSGTTQPIRVYVIVENSVPSLLKVYCSVLRIDIESNI